MNKISTAVQMLKLGLKMGGKKIIQYAPEGLTLLGSIGVVSAIVITAKKAPDAKKEFDEEKAKWEAIEDKEKRVKADYIFKLVRIGARYYWVVISIATGSIVCFWLANRITFKRFMSALTAAGIATKSKEELEEKIKELDGDKHLKKLRDEIDSDRIKNDPPVEDRIINTGYGMHLCYEPITGRYFYSNIEKIRRAVINCREYLQKDGYLALNDWFNELGLDTTENNLCWTANNFDEINEWDISSSSQLTPDDVPVFVIRYDVNPIMERRDW